MSFISVALRLWHALIASLKIAHRLCRYVDRLDTKIQASTVSDTVKTAVANLKTSTHDVCDLIQANKDALG